MHNYNYAEFTDGGGQLLN